MNHFLLPFLGTTQITQVTGSQSTRGKSGTESVQFKQIIDPPNVVCFKVNNWSHKNKNRSGRRTLVCNSIQAKAAVTHLCNKSRNVRIERK